MRKRPGRHRARAFARAVDGSGAPSPSVSRLVSLANALRNAPVRGSSPRSGLRQQLMLEAAAPRPVEHRSLVAEWLDRFRFQRGLASTTVLCTVLIAVAGIGFGTTESLPGDTLYSMKLRSESVQLAFIGSDEQRGKKNLKYADARLNEIIKLVRHQGDWPATAARAAEEGEGSVAKLINKTFATMDASTAAGAKAMRQAFERTGDTSPLAYLDEFTDQQQNQLKHLIPTLPTESKASASDSLAFMGELSKETAKILGTGCEGGSGSAAGSECGDATETSAASSPTTPSDEPGSTSPSTSAQSPTTSDETGTGTSAVPPATGSTGESTTGTGSDTSSDPSDTGSSSDGGSSTGTPTTGDGSSDDDSSDSTGSTSGTPDTPTSEPPEPTGVPSDPSGSGSQSKSDTAASTPDENDRQSAPAEDQETASTTSAESEAAPSSPGDTAEPSDTP